MLETTFRLILKSQIYSNENLHTYVTYELPKKYANKTYIILNEKSFYGGTYDLHSPLFYLDEPINLYCHSKKANLVKKVTMINKINSQTESHKQENLCAVKGTLLLCL